MKTPRISPHKPKARVLIASVADGDTFHGSWHQGDVTIRLLGFDAPEIGQACGGWAAAMVRRILTARILTARLVCLDRYGRSVMDLRWPDGGRVSITLLEAGLGHVDRRYAPQLDSFLQAETSARLKAFGIWQYGSPQTPWSFRGYKPSPWLKRRSRCHYRFRR